MKAKHIKQILKFSIHLVTEKYFVSYKRWPLISINIHLREKKMMVDLKKTNHETHTFFSKTAVKLKFE